jgi:AraC-like DNA-binding protein/mannose-6-phosphate isomerase-like protein (cupin superfamily)
MLFFDCLSKRNSAGNTTHSIPLRKHPYFSRTNPHILSQPFTIFRLERPPGHVDADTPPHTHDFQEILFIESGNAYHQIDDEQYTVPPQSVLLVVQGKKHVFRPDADTTGWVIRFQNEFMEFTCSTLFSSFMELSIIPYKDTPAEFAHLLNLVRLTADEFTAPHANTQTVRFLLNAIVSKLKEAKQRFVTHQHNSGSGFHYDIFNQFMALLEEHFKTEQSPAFYAEKLNVTTRTLGEICKKIFNQTTSDIIDRRIIIEAKRMLLYSGLPVQQVGYELGYEDKSYFSRVFKRQTGMTPKEYQEKHQ